jgi:hypothetical protein
MYPGQELLLLLNKIRIELDNPSSIPLQALKYRLENSGLERTVGLLENLGDDCSFYRKSLDIFLRRDFSDIHKIINAIDSSFPDILKAKKLMDSLMEV